MEALPLSIFWGLAIWGVFSRRPVLIYLFFATMPFAAFAAIPPAATGGLTFTATPIVAVLIIVRTLGNAAGIDFTLGSVLSRHRTLTLFLFWVCAVFTTAFMPRFFAGQVYVIPMRYSPYSRMIQPLFPSTQNISQLAYLTISVFAVVAFSRLLSRPEMREHAVKAIFLGAALTVFTGVLDEVNSYVSLKFILDPFRTATYSLITGAEILGVKRIVGLTPEASTFGGLCIAFLAAVYFLRRTLSPKSFYYRVSPVLLGLLALFVWRSTSSAAYVAFFAFLMIAAMEWSWSATMVQPSRQRRGLRAEFWVAFTGLAALTVICLIQPSMLDPLTNMIDKMVFQKSSSSSFEERSMWNEISWRALLDTYGLGVGMGGTRASSSFVATVSSIGFLGSFFFYLFMLQTLLLRTSMCSQPDRAIISAVRWCLWPGFITGLLAGTTADFGLFNAFLLGLPYAVIAGAVRARAHKPVTPLEFSR